MHIVISIELVIISRGRVWLQSTLQMEFSESIFLLQSSNYIAEINWNLILNELISVY